MPKNLNNIVKDKRTQMLRALSTVNIYRQEGLILMIKMDMVLGMNNTIDAMADVEAWNWAIVELGLPKKYMIWLRR